MKKQSVFIKHVKQESGFLFPYILFITAIVLLSVMTSITIYTNDKKMTTLQLEQIELETLHQMAYRAFTIDITSISILDKKGQVYYDFPNGDVTVTYYANGSGKWQCEFLATTLLENSKTNVQTINISLHEKN